MTYVHPLYSDLSLESHSGGILWQWMCQFGGVKTGSRLWRWTRSLVDHPTIWLPGFHLPDASGHYWTGSGQDRAIAARRKKYQLLPPWPNVTVVYDIYTLQTRLLSIGLKSYGTQTHTTTTTLHETRSNEDQQLLNMKRDTNNVRLHTNNAFLGWRRNDNTARLISTK